MAITITDITRSNTVKQLDTYNYTVPTAGMYTTTIDMSEVPTSTVSIAIKKNGSTQLTSAVPAAAQLHIPLRLVMNLAANDVIGVTISSSSAIDQQLNTIKGTLTITQGSSN